MIIIALISFIIVWLYCSTCKSKY